MNQAAAAGREVLAPMAGGAILYDDACVDHPEPALFRPAHWQARGALEVTPGGRGTIAFVRTPGGERWVLRHYRRGGFVARLFQDAYLWLGPETTRSFREWRLLRQLRELGLPVPRPIAAAYVRDGLLRYRADLITAELPTRLTLAQALRDRPLDPGQWQAIGRTVARLHEQGVHHADLNAHNLLLDTDGLVYVLDFDRGRVRPRGAWEERVLARLQRSLLKVTATLPDDRFGDPQWQALLRGLSS
jgi:3-deoxy-D-manno-octulosonic acid kinase